MAVDERGDEEEGTKEYLVKWRDLSYEECTWEPPAEILPLEGTEDRLEEFKAR